MSKSGKTCFFVYAPPNKHFKLYSFLGEYEVAIDAKGRFLLPAGFRKQLGEGEGKEFVINRGFEGCMVLYPMKVWEPITANLNKLNDLIPENREFKRLFLNGATKVEVDSADRILLPKPLMEYAGIKKEMVFSTQGNKVELWDKEAYYQIMKGGQNRLSELGAIVAAGGNFNPFQSGGNE